jgi:hypothetical protein
MVIVVALSVGSAHTLQLLMIASPNPLLLLNILENVAVKVWPKA